MFYRKLLKNSPEIYNQLKICKGNPLDSRSPHILSIRYAYKPSRTSRGLQTFLKLQQFYVLWFNKPIQFSLPWKANIIFYDKGKIASINVWLTVTSGPLFSSSVSWPVPLVSVTIDVAAMATLYLSNWLSCQVQMLLLFQSKCYVKFDLFLAISLFSCFFENLFKEFKMKRAWSAYWSI